MVQRGHQAESLLQRRLPVLCRQRPAEGRPQRVPLDHPLSLLRRNKRRFQTGSRQLNGTPVYFCKGKKRVLFASSLCPISRRQFAFLAEQIIFFFFYHFRPPQGIMLVLLALLFNVCYGSGVLLHKAMTGNNTIGDIWSASFHVQVSQAHTYTLESAIFSTVSNLDFPVLIFSALGFLRPRASLLTIISVSRSTTLRLTTTISIPRMQTARFEAPTQSPTSHPLVMKQKLSCCC